MDDSFILNIILFDLHSSGFNSEVALKLQSSCSRFLNRYLLTVVSVLSRLDVEVVICGSQITKILIENRVFVLLACTYCKLSHLVLHFQSLMSSLRALRKQVAFLSILTLSPLVNVTLLVLVLTFKQGISSAIVGALVVSGVLVYLVEIIFPCSLIYEVRMIRIYSKIS